jgi:tRNA-specific 2-thiouridylase
MAKILIAMSGGIDSSVAAMLLLEQGYELVGVTFRTFDSIRESCLAKEKGCCSVESMMEAKHLAEQLGFEHHILDYRDIFRRHVIQNFTDEYMHGRTPNPCVLCNSHIKWGELLRAADEFGCEKIATGHYARIAECDGHYYLRRAADQKKDQTYFLWMLTEENLRRTVFPLGDLTKDEVRELARQHGFEKLSMKRESQEICFVPNNDYRRFLVEQGCTIEPGDYVDETGRVLGRHEGFACYTLGQRKGLGIALGTPQFVTKIDAAANRVTLGTHDALYTREVQLKDGWWRGRTSEPVMAQIRYRSLPTGAHYRPKQAQLLFDEPVWAVTPGQSAVIYQDDLLVGGGLIQ